MTEIIYGPKCMSCGGCLVEVRHYKVFETEYICVGCLHSGTNDLIYNFLKEKGSLEDIDVLEEEC